MQDLGIFAYRTIGKVSLAAGSALDFVHAVQSSKDSPGIVIANMGQLRWYRRGARAVTYVSWSALPRKWGISEAYRIDPVKNRVPHNENMATHVKYVFEEVVGKMVNEDAALDIIGVGEGATHAVHYLESNWPKWASRVQAIAVGTSTFWPGDTIENPPFKEFWSKVCSFTLSGPNQT